MIIHQLRKKYIAIWQSMSNYPNYQKKHIIVSCKASHFHYLVTEGGMDEAGVFQRMNSFDDVRLAEVFAREVLSPEWAERLLSWRHTGFSVHSRVRAKTKPEA